MSELRYNVATGDWVVIATERARRPDDYIGSGRERTHQRADHSSSCPFCPGSEDHTERESLRYYSPRGGWQVRAFPNRYPALQAGPVAAQHGDSFHRSRSGFGVHEVLVESALHNTTLALQPTDEVAQVVRAWRERSKAVAATPGIEHVVVFKNHGPGAGCSLEHPHSQLVGLPVIPASVRGRTQTALAYYRKHDRCVFCDMIASEWSDPVRVVASNESFVAFVPFAAYSPYSLWLFPRQHSHSFVKLPDAQIEALASLLRDVLGRLYRHLGDPDYNLVVRSGHPPGPGSHFLHWYIAIVPRLVKMAGFELGTGMFINGSSPEKDAERLRGDSASEPSSLEGS